MTSSTHCPDRLIRLFPERQSTSFDSENDNFVTVLLTPLNRSMNHDALNSLASFFQVGHLGYLNVSDLAQHGALKVFDHVFDYSETGLQIIRAVEVESQFHHVEKVGTTLRTKHDFLDWVYRNEIRFRAAKYSPGHNNCHHFVEAACEFLGVSVPWSMRRILDWLRETGANAVNFLHKVTGSLASSLGLPNRQSTFLSSFASSSGRPQQAGQRNVTTPAWYFSRPSTQESAYY